MDSGAGCLYLVPTPIGNLSDITARALEILEEVDLIACEDTRTTGRLLNLLGLSNKLVSYHEFNESARAEQLLGRLKEGNSIAVVTDGGSPGISDPAFRIVRAALKANITIVPLPGPTAIIPALTASGLPTDRFFFEGFLSNKSAARKKRLGDLSEYPHTLVFYESPHRVVKCLHDIHEVLGDRPACLAREISKKFEQFIRGTVSEVLGSIPPSGVKGEIVLVIGGKDK